MSAAIGDSGISYDFFFYNADNEVWNGTAFVTWSDVDFASYRVAATETGTSGEFPVPTPPTGATRYVMRERGATLALSYKTYTHDLKLSDDAATAATQATAAALDATAIKAKTDLIGSGTAFSGPPVTESGQLTRIVIGDDYSAANGRAFSWTFDAITGFTVGSCTAKFGLKHATNPTAYSALVTAATVTDLGSGRWSVSFDVDKTDTASLPQAHYEWSVEIIHSGEEVTIAKSEETRDRVKLVTKQT